MVPRTPAFKKIRTQLVDSGTQDLGMEAAIGRSIVSIPKGKVATYGQVAAAAGYPNHHRQTARVLRKIGDRLPWYRVVGAGGQIKTRMESALDQRLRLEMEGVRFRGSRVDMSLHQSPLHSPDAKPATRKRTSPKSPARKAKDQR